MKSENYKLFNGFRLSTLIFAFLAGAFGMALVGGVINITEKIQLIMLSICQLILLVILYMSESYSEKYFKLFIREIKGGQHQSDTMKQKEHFEA